MCKICCLSLFFKGVCFGHLLKKKGNNGLTHQQDPVVFCTCRELQTWKVSKLRDCEGGDAGEQQGCNWLELQHLSSTKHL